MSKPPTKRDYEVGHGRTPASTRFQKGRSGNPKGPPRGRHNRPPYNAVLGRMMVIKEGGVERQVTAAETFLLHITKPADLGLEPKDELLVLTNFHVVNAHGASPGIRPEVAEVVFEAVDQNKANPVAEILWSSPPERHDAALLRLGEPVAGIPPLPIARILPTLDEEGRVYIIGHPGGRDLAFSFQDNELLDHEGPPTGKPPIPGVCRVHYRAPTEGGSSGSSVFNASYWEVVALHHKGGKLGMPRFNGKEGTYAANEGIGIQCIKEAIPRSTVE